MPISQDHNDLFHSSSAADKLLLFQSMLDAKDLESGEALALLSSIHADLEQPQSDHSTYVRYAEMMERLRQEMPEVHQAVLSTWRDAHARIQAAVSASEVEAEAEEGTESREEKSNRFQFLSHPGCG